jgi:hypothetical protein
MSMPTSMFTNRPIYDSIRRWGTLVGPTKVCPVAEKANFENRESNQAVVWLANENFGLEGDRTASGPGPQRRSAAIFRRALKGALHREAK